jgi:enoyl-CoA hydratase
MVLGAREASVAIKECLHDGGVLELVVDHPPVNAFTIGDLHTLARRLRAIADEPEVTVVLLRSEGKGFCAGGDVKEVQALPGFDGILGQASGSEAASIAVAECAVPVVVAVHGYCVGVGVLLVGTADVVVAGTGTPFVLAEVDNGATSGGAQALGLVPAKRLRAAMFTAEPIDAAELQAYGSIYRLVAPDEVVSTAFRVAEVIAAKSPAVVRRLKQSLNASAGVDDLRRRYRLELSYTYELNLLGEARDLRETFVDGRRSGYLPVAEDP